MCKVAVFVEGLTEQLFVVRLITELLGSKGATIQLGEQHRGVVNYQPVVGTLPPNASVFVLVVDCKSDEQVKTQIRDQYQSLINAGYTAIIGLRDVYPWPRAAIPQVQAALNAGLPTVPVVPSMHLAVMEAEAWFLAERTHFVRVHPNLNPAAIAAGGFNLSQACELWNHPAQALDDIYRIAGCRYLKRDGSKSKRRLERTIAALSYNEIYVTLRPLVPALDAFVASIETAIF